MAQEAQSLNDKSTELMLLASQGDRAALRQLLPWMQENGQVLFEQMGLARTVRRKLGQSLFGSVDCLREHLLEKEYEALSTSLCGTDPTPIEAILSEQVCLCWIALRIAELKLESDGSQSERLEKQRLAKVESANRRFLAAVRTLAQIQKLNAPINFQVNVCKNQLNFST